LPGTLITHRLMDEELLGRTRISATLEIYTDTDEQAGRDAATELHDLFDQPQD
jgi:hypothetical protein